LQLFFVWLLQLFFLWLLQLFLYDYCSYFLYDYCNYFCMIIAVIFCMIIAIIFRVIIVIIFLMNINCSIIIRDIQCTVFSRKWSFVCTIGEYYVNMNPLKTKHRLLNLKSQFVPRSKHSPLRLYKTYLLTLYKVQVHTKHINAMWAPCRIFEC
jgi:hypothetical protein